MLRGALNCTWLSLPPTDWHVIEYYRVWPFTITVSRMLRSSKYKAMNGSSCRSVRSGIPQTALTCHVLDRTMINPTHVGCHRPCLHTEIRSA
jgi:hypothetical protein